MCICVIHHKSQPFTATHNSVAVLIHDLLQHLCIFRLYGAIHTNAVIIIIRLLIRILRMPLYRCGDII